MPQPVRITTLVENTAAGPEVLAEHGLSFWIDAPGGRVLFDTGQGRTLLGNALKLGVPLEQADAIVLSHGHYDHTGGLGDALRSTFRPPIYAHPDAFVPRFSRQADGTFRGVGIPYWTEQEVCRHTRELVRVLGPAEVVEGLWLSGPIERTCDFEDTGGDFYLDEGGRQVDPLPDDQALYFNSAGGTVVVLGCAHSGVISTLMHIRNLTNGRPLRAVIGGMHLLSASSQRIERTAQGLRDLGVQELWPAHCTGPAAWACLRQEFGQACHPCPVGTTIDLPTR